MLQENFFGVKGEILIRRRIIQATQKLFSNNLGKTAMLLKGNNTGIIIDRNNSIKFLLALRQ